jgi:hypothetical protein
MGTLAIFVLKKNTIHVFYLFLLTWHTHYLGLEKKFAHIKAVVRTCQSNDIQ